MGKKSVLIALFFTVSSCLGFLVGLPERALCQPKACGDTRSGTDPILEIKRMEPGRPVYSIELREARLIDIFGVIARDYKLNILIDPSICGTITASLTDISLEEALDAIAELSNLNLERKGNVVMISRNPVAKIMVWKYNQPEKSPEAPAAILAAPVLELKNKNAGLGGTDERPSAQEQALKKAEEQLRFSSEDKAKRADPERKISGREAELREKEALSRKIEDQRSAAEEKEKRISAERDRQAKLSIEAENKARHAKYVAQLEALLRRQNNLLEEGRKMELEIHREEKNLKKAERDREDALNRLLEQPGD